MQDTGVVDNETVAGVQAKTYLHPGIINDLAETTAGGIIGFHQVKRHIDNGGAGAVVKPDRPEVTFRRQFDDGPTGTQPNSGFARIFELRTMAAQQLKPDRVLLSQSFCRPKAINDHIFTALGRAFEAIQDLQTGHWVAIRIVGMGLQAKAGEGEVGRVDFCPYLEMSSVIGFPDITEQTDDTEQSLIPDRAARQYAKAMAGNQSEPVRQGRLVCLYPSEFCGGQGMH